MKKLIVLILFSPSFLWGLSKTPQVTIQSPKNGDVILGDSLIISGTAADADGIVEVSMDLDGNGFSTFAYQGGDWKTIMTPSSLSNGPHTISVRVHNKSGYETTSSVSISVNNPTVIPTEPPAPPTPPLLISLNQAISDPTISTTTAQVYIDLKKMLFRQ